MSLLSVFNASMPSRASPSDSAASLEITPFALRSSVIEIVTSDALTFMLAATEAAVTQRHQHMPQQ